MKKFIITWVETSWYEYPEPIEAKDEDEAQDILFASEYFVCPEPEETSTTEVFVREITE